MTLIRLMVKVPCVIQLHLNLHFLPHLPLFSLFSFFSSIGCADDEALTRFLQSSFFFGSLYQSWYFSDIFLLQVLLDIVRPDPSGKSFLVSCQAVTNTLLVG